MKLDKIVQLLALALSPTTLGHEADTALRKADKLGQEDGTVASLLDSIQKLRAAKAEAEWDLSQCRSTMEALQAQNLSLKVEAQQLQAEVEGLEAEVGTLKAAASDNNRSYVTFDSFGASAGRTYGRKLWKSAFAFEAGITVKEINAWETVGLAPADWLAKLDALTDYQRKPTARKPWTAEERARLRAVLDHGHSDLATAQILTEEFGRRLYESSVANQRRQLFRNDGWAPQGRPGSGRGRARGRANPLH